jgi:hypothetical protein
MELACGHAGSGRLFLSHETPSAVSALLVFVSSWEPEREFSLRENDGASLRELLLLRAGVLPRSSPRRMITPGMVLLGPGVPVYV